MIHTFHLWGGEIGFLTRFFQDKVASLKTITFEFFWPPMPRGPVWDQIFERFAFFARNFFFANVSYFSLKKARKGMRTKKGKENELRQIIQSNKSLNIGIQN